MAQSIEKRIEENGGMAQFIKEVGMWGRWHTMEKWGVGKSYVQVVKIIVEKTGNENYGLNPTAGSYIKRGIRGLLQECISTLADVYLKKERENKELKRQLEAYRMSDKQLEHEFADEISGLMEALKSEG